ncbi:PorP/SprF family type IX secretion system membrane protein [Pedobacter metabolipauper]|uniref:Type IX secretion system PorP/SprF family membrane protein n=1 Tax=Pedobacter metabolipauper TaxID=425513 RepID=A0A4R6SSM7_9SPHI|nr:PorP/SprF family type IX secretion system membrane protein [Pedobacter metabolipauper]TDQ07395.1 type IX secretion system PorP/SprF family membrane protein [Pedobacter metabolipauper]
MSYNIALPILLLILLVGGRISAQQQVYSYSQYADNLTPVNSAYAMLDKSGFVSALGHRQFIGIEDAPSSLMFTGSLPITPIHASAGIYLLNDRTPLVRQLEINTFFAKSIQITSNQYLSIGVNAGMRNYASNYSALDPSDPEFMTDVHDTKPNIGFSMMYYSDRFYLGLSAPQLTFGNPETAFAQQTNPLKSPYFFSGAFLAVLSDEVKLKPAVLVSYVKNTPIAGSFSGTLYIKETFGIGAYYNSDKVIAGTVSVTFSNFKIGYSYATGISYNTRNLNNARNEIGLSYRFGSERSPKLL